MKKFLEFLIDILLLYLYLVGVVLFIAALFGVGDLSTDGSFVLSIICAVLGALIVKIKAIRNRRFYFIVNWVAGPFLVLVGIALMKDPDYPYGLISLIESIAMLWYMGIYKNPREEKRVDRDVSKNNTSSEVKNKENARDLLQKEQMIVEVDVQKADSLIKEKKAVKEVVAEYKKVSAKKAGIDNQNETGYVFLSIDDLDKIAAISSTKAKGDAFEKYCCKLLELNHFTDVKRVGGSGDRGADILARKGMKKYIIQCKCYKSSVPYSAFQATMSARKLYMAEGIIMTNSHFSKNTKQDAEEQGVILWDREELIRLINNANEELKWRYQNQ